MSEAQLSVGAPGALGGRAAGAAHAGGAGAGVETGQPVLEVRGLRKSYGHTLALDGVDLSVGEGELVTLLGPSGSGKTTLLKTIAGFEAPSGGEVRLRGREVSALSPARRGIGMVFQHYALFPHMTVAENVAYGLKLRRVARAERRRKVAQMLELLHLDGLAERYPRQLSGGQQQRVALGRALAYDPQLILMDEPLGALDRSLRIEMEQEIRALHRRLNATVVYVTHDQQEALALSDRIAVMRGGVVVGLGTPAELFERPPNSFVAQFFTGANLLPVQEHSPAAPGRARVVCAGVEFEPAATASAGEPVVLAVRPRSLGRTPVPGGLRVAGALAEIHPLGDEQELVLDAGALGAVRAVLGSRDCTGLRPGEPLELFAAAGETVLVARS